MRTFWTPIALIAAFSSAASARAEDQVTFAVTVDRTQITLDDSVSLKFSVKADGSTQSGDPEFQAPDFEIVNQYQSTFIESYYENGKFGMRNNRTFTLVLRPKAEGTFSISGLRIEVNGKGYQAEPIAIRVTRGGAGTPPPRNYHQNSPGSGLRGSTAPSDNRAFFARAEVDKSKAYKGEQVIVSYYLYRRVRVFNIQVEKYPVLNGFLREDLDMPVQGQRLDSEQVLMNGVPYQRSLLLRYAAYPLKEGKLSVDAIALKANYFPDSAPEEDDPFQGFFQNFNARAGTMRSEVFSVEVLPLPSQGKPSGFSGGVGDFQLSAGVDKSQGRVNDPVTLTVKVEGQGNVAAIGEPRIDFPSSVEVYDSNSKVRSAPGGVGEKTFEILLIPRQPGPFTIPPIEFSFFDPGRREYVTKTTEPFEIQVAAAGDGATQEALPTARSKARSKSAGAKENNVQDQLLGLREPQPDTSATPGGQPFWRWLYWLSALGLLVFVAIVLRDLVSRVRNRESKPDPSRTLAKAWDDLETNSTSLPLREGLDRLYELIFDAIDQRYAIGARSLSRSELKRILVEEKSLDIKVFDQTARLLERIEMAQFAGQSRDDENSRQSFQKWVEEGRLLADTLARA